MKFIVACTASMQAVVLAQNIILSNQADNVLVLGIELANRVTVSGFTAMQLLSETASKPLGKNRDGMVLGEAVAVMHLSTSHSRWQVLGGASLVSGKDITGATPSAVHDVCQLALSNSRLQPTDIDIIKLQASGSPSDIHEIDGLQQVFRIMPSLVTWKHLIGHTLGVSGLAEMILSMVGREQGIWPEYDYELDNVFGIEKLADAPIHSKHLLAIILVTQTQ